MKVLTVYSRHGTHSRRSGYDVLGAYLRDVEPITAARGDPRALLPRLGARLLRACAASRWFQGSSAQIERQAAKHLRVDRPDILHYLWADHDLGYLAPWVRRLSPGTRLIGTLHLPPAMLEKVLRFPRALRHFDALILMSTQQADYLRDIGVEARRLHVLLHGVDTHFFHPGPSVPTMPFRVLSVGGFLRDFDLLHAICTACERDKNLRFEIIGPSAHRPRFTPLRNVIYRHGLTDEELAQAYRDASCLLLTLVDSTANNSLLEAMASGLPIVSETIGGVVDYLDRDVAVLCPPKDVAALVGALRRLAASPAEAQSLREGARRRAETLAWPRVAEQTQALYRQLVERQA